MTADAGPDGGAPACGESLATQRTACTFASGALPKDTLGDCATKPIPIEHIIIAMQENRSFDHYFGHLPGHGQDDVDVPPADEWNPSPPDAGVPPAPVPWHHDQSYCIDDTDHGWVASHGQYDDGKNDGFALTNVIAQDRTGQRALGYYDQTDIPFYYSLASTFAISDRYFCSLLGPTYPNREYLLAGTSFGSVATDEGPRNGLAPAGVPNIFKVLDAAGITWRDYYSDLPAAFLFSDYEPTAVANGNVVDVSQFAIDAAAGNLPQVSFIDPTFLPVPDIQSETDEHPPADIQVGQHFIWTQVTALLSSPNWKSSAMFITYDEHGGMYDHVPPPAACPPDDTPPDENPEIGGYDRLGFRVPVFVVSPYAKRHFVSHQVHSHTSILRFLETKFNLPALTNRDANSDAMFDFFDFDSPPDLTVPAFTEPAVDPTQLTACTTPSTE